MTLPTRQSIPLPLKGEFLDLIHDLLSPSECQDIIDSHTPDLIALNQTYNPSLRNNTRCMFNDPALADLLWSRLRPTYDGITITTQDPIDIGQWTPHALNTRFRLCRYHPGEYFGPHIDGSRLASINEQSFITVNIYLNDVPESSGGSTRVLSDDNDVLYRVQPKRGMASLFRDTLFHDGEELRAGEKFLLRTDIMFLRSPEFVFPSITTENKKSLGELSMRIAEELEAGGNGVEAVEYYRRAYKLCPELEK
ncbi:hypothetical protein PROFUN_09017 [Planoprotostelium fungivorum]|uniref:Fe2OG dioxygenase domain-containing protein n=1 Tax=Planoprotostelium fungivorum TaxID=1890364 RepID=A0A2P6MUY3_9EUKA|nr:hypothetical protein PROFUN_09017 [Planoprotostelium fungivorum]